MKDGEIDEVRELYDEICSVLERARQSGAPVRAIALIEFAQLELQTYLDAISERAETAANH